MESSAKEKLHAFKPRHSFFVGIDSDGCVFDTMEIKQKECFIPNIIKYWKLQAISKYARAAAEFVNLYSKWRGINRFPALTKTIELLRDWPEAMRRGVELPDLASLQAWIDSGAAAGQSCAGSRGRENRRSGAEAGFGVEQGRQPLDRRVVEGVPPFPSFPRLPGEACAASGHHLRLRNARRGFGTRVAGTRHRQIRRRHRGAGNGQQEGTPEDRRRGQVREGLRLNDRRRAGRPGGRARQRRLVLSHQSRPRRAVLGEVLSRRHRAFLQQTYTATTKPR